MALSAVELEGALRELSPAGRAELHAECSRIARERGLEVGGQAISVIAVPAIVPCDRTRELFRQLDVFVDVLVRLERCALDDTNGPLYRRLFASLSAGGRRLVRSCAYESRFSLERRHRRLDGFLDLAAGGCRLIEVNQAAPLGLSFHDTAQRIAARVLDAAGFAGRTRRLAPHLLRWLLEEHAERRPGSTLETVALVLETGYPVKLVDLPRMARDIEAEARAAGMDTLAILPCLPHELRLRSGRVEFRGRTVDLVWRNSVYLAQYDGRAAEIADYVRICADPERHLIVNSTRSWLTRTKEVFALLSSDEVCRAIGLSPAERGLLRELVPETVNLRYEPERLQELRASREHWVFKPSDSGFGAGVEFGASCAQEHWDSLLQRATQEDGFVVQRRVEPPVRPVLELEPDGGLHGRSVIHDFCPHHVGGRFSGTAMVRALPLARGPYSKMSLLGGAAVLPVVVSAQEAGAGS